jgi:hypothetical protein
MSLSSDARADLEHLKSEFEAASREHPGLEHILVETTDGEPFGETQDELKHLLTATGGPHTKVRKAWCGRKRRGEIHVFTDKDPGPSAFEEFSSLAEAAIEILDAFELPHQAMLPPEAADPNHDSMARWMMVVHRLARDRRPGDLLRSKSDLGVGGLYPLPHGTLAWTFRYDVFRASSLALGRILRDIAGTNVPGPAATPEGEKEAPGGPTPPPRGGEQDAATAKADIDFDALFEALLRANKHTSAKLVLFMKHRTIATFQEVMDQAFGKELEESTLRSYANRATNDLRGLESRLWFETKEAQVIRHVDPA